jgi:hypothetical protein
MENHKLAALIASQEWHLDRLYSEYTRELGYLFRNHSGAVSQFKQKEMERVLERFRMDLEKTVSNQVSRSIDLSDQNTQLFTANYLKGMDLPGQTVATLLSVNTDATSAFLQRTLQGMNLSERVWNLTEQTKESLDHVLSSGILEGRSARDMAKDLKSYLKEPDRNFRRVRNADGKLVLSNPAKDYHPGQGVYRSSYKNALRLSRNEVNIAYRSNDHERRKNLPFVLGQKIQLSNAHPAYDICDELTGDYPKDFRFVGWHVNCLCFTTSIKVPRDQFKAYLGGEALNTSNLVKTMPKNALNYLNDNAKTIRGWSNPPYFITDNFKFSKGVFVPKFGKVGPTVIKKPKAAPVIPLANVLTPPAAPKYIPVNTPEEAAARIRALGIRQVDFYAKVSKENLNAIVQGFEEEARFSPVKLDRFFVFKKGQIRGKNGTANGLYYDDLGGDGKPAIGLNTTYLNRKFVKSISEEPKAVVKRLKDLVNDYETNYLGNHRYNQTQVLKALRDTRQNLKTWEDREAKGYTARPWSFSSSQKDRPTAIKGTLVHEIGHYRHFRQLNLTKDFNFNGVTSLTQYGETNFKEYFTEWYTYWRNKGDENVPADLLKLFKTIPRT